MANKRPSKLLVLDGMPAGRLGISSYRRRRDVEVIDCLLDTVVSVLIPKELLATLPNLYDTTAGGSDPLCQVKLFTPDANWTWYIIEYSQDDKDTCYGYVQGLEDELGYFSLEEIKGIRSSLGLPVERDIFFEPTLLSEIKAGR